MQGRCASRRPRAPPRQRRSMRPRPRALPALALKCLHDEYPNHLSLTIDSDAGLRPPRELTPAFYGCYDWHSDVHGHWLLVRLLHLFPDAPFAPAARAAVARSLTAQNIAGELELSQARRSSLVRAALRARMAAAAVRGAARLERPAGAAVVGRTCSRSRPKPRRGSRNGCRSSTIPSASANTIRPPFRSA